MHIAFLTLFLGLVRGVQPVALDASPGVAAVELVLDGHPAGRIAGRLAASPWTGKVDFGPALLPHHLEARALDASGRELARAEQWVNVARQQAEVEVLPLGGKPGQPEALRLAWESLTGGAPKAIHLSVDGMALAVDAQGTAKLPALAPGAPHVVSAELEFDHGRGARRRSSGSPPASSRRSWPICSSRAASRASSRAARSSPTRWRPPASRPSPARCRGRWSW